MTTPLAVFQAWILALLLLLSPPEKRADFQRHTSRVLPAEQRETTEEGRARYAGIAADLTAVLFEDETKPLFPGKRGREHTAAVLLAVAYLESGFRKDVDLGAGKLGRGDHGRSWCLMQVQAGLTGTVPSGSERTRSYTGADLVADRKKCFRAGLEMVRQSLSACKDQPLKDRLAVYASGSCDKGLAESRMRMALAGRITKLLPFPEQTNETPPPAPETNLGTLPSSLAHAAP
jgi:hypothetical protein